MIDIVKGLRRIAEEGYKFAGDAADEIERLRTSREAAEKERDFAKAEIARLHDDIRELTDERVLDEEDRERIVAHLQGEAKAKLDRLEAVEKELVDLRSSMKFRTSLIGQTEAERDALRAKVNQMDAAFESLLIRCDDSDSAMCGTLSTSFVRDTVRIARGT